MTRYPGFNSTLHGFGVSSVCDIGNLYGGPPRAREWDLVRCEYCARVQDRDPKGGCCGCGAPLGLPAEQEDALRLQRSLAFQSRGKQT